jgi:hypothetical protein
MTLIIVIGVVIGVVSFGGAAFLLSLWHEDHATGTRGWPLTRVLAYLAIAGTLASNVLAAVALLRLMLPTSEFIVIRDALQPLTFTALITLLLLFPVLAVYLRAVRSTGYISPAIVPFLATEASVQEAIKEAKAAYHEANDVNVKIATLTELVAGKEDK